MPHASCHYPDLCSKGAFHSSRSDGLNLAVRFNGKLVKTPPRRVATLDREQPMLEPRLPLRAKEDQASLRDAGKSHASTVG